MKEKLIINFAPTGMKPTKDWTPYVPITPNEIIEDVHRAYDLGITIVHLHARNEETEEPVHEASAYEKIITGIKKHCKDLLICITTSGRKFGEFEKRSEALELKPDMASLTLSSLNFLNDASTSSPQMIQKLAIKMNEYGVHPELECFDGGMVNYGKYLIRKEILKPPFYWNLLFGNIFSAQPNMATMGTTIRDLPPDSIYSLAGLGGSQLKVAVHAIASGSPGVRIGLEDNVYYDAGKKIFAKNYQLLERVHKVAEIFERKVMSPKEFGSLGFYNSKS
jgi:uncharacterized protein (DUF849 family)